MKIKTTWQVNTYDVWGNAKDGYEVNDVFRGDEIELDLTVKTHNIGTAAEFQCATPSDTQIRSALGCSRVRLSIDEYDCAIYVNRDRDRYPLGELICISHSSLSPITVI